MKNQEITRYFATKQNANLEGQQCGIIQEEFHYDDNVGKFNFLAR